MNKYVFFLKLKFLEFSLFLIVPDSIRIRLLSVRAEGCVNEMMMMIKGWFVVIWGFIYPNTHKVVKKSKHDTHFHSSGGISAQNIDLNRLKGSTYFMYILSLTYI